MKLTFPGTLFAATLFVFGSPASADCDYTDADQNNGFGYDNDTGLSCPPVDNNFCDYTNAGENDGFGYNHYSGESCSPRTSPPMLSIYSKINSQSTDVSNDSSLIRVYEAYCDAGDIATGGGCALKPGEPPLPDDHGWRIVQTIPSRGREGWNCGIMCTGQLNADGTRDTTMCLDTEFNVRVMCLKQN